MGSAAASRVVLDRRIAEEGLIALNPPFERPEWYYELTAFPFMPIAFVMGEDGTLSRRWQLVDEVDWRRAVAVRFETPYGAPINVEELGADEEYH